MKKKYYPFSLKKKYFSLPSVQKDTLTHGHDCDGILWNYFFSPSVCPAALQETRETFQTDNSLRE